MSKFNWPWGQARRANERRSPRYRSGIGAELGWWDEGTFRSCPVVVADVSQGGAAVVADGPTPAGGTAHIRVVDATEAGWVEVEILAVRPARGRRTVVHLRFMGGPSYALFRSAIPDADLDHVHSDDDPEIYDARTWR